MTGDEFITVAIRLAGGSIEGEFRSSVSRAYFGAFHVSRQFIEGFGVRFPKSDQAHTKVRYCLFHADDKEARRAAELLDALRAARNLADYDLQDRNFAVPAAAKSALALAQGVCGLLAQCDAPERKPNIQARVRDYARTVLGLNVL